LAPFRAVLFAVDGTLVDSNDAHAWAWVEALRKYKLSAPFHMVRPLIGMHSDKLLKELTGIRERNPVARLVADTRASVFSRGYVLSVRTFPEAQQLLERLRADQIRVAAFSMASPGDLDRLLETGGLDQLIDIRIAADSIAAPRHERDLVESALTKLRLPPEDVVLIGDSPYDLAAATRAGVQSIAFRCGGWTDRWLTGALAIYDHPSDLLEHYDESPLMQGALRRA